MDQLSKIRREIASLFPNDVDLIMDLAVAGTNKAIEALRANAELIGPAFDKQLVLSILSQEMLIETLQKNLFQVNAEMVGRFANEQQ